MDLTNNEIKYYSSLKVKKYREAERKFLVEGVHLVDECLKSPVYKKNIERIIIRNGFDYKHPDLKQFQTDFISEKDFNKISETVSSQGIIAVVKIPGQSSQEINGNIIIALENISDPGNLGTAIRTAYWFDVNPILISKNSVDLYNSKTLRSSQGAIFHSDIISEINPSEELDKLKSNGYEILLTDLNADAALSQYKIDKNKKYVIVFGNEANGISEELKNKNFKKIKIDGFSDCESLNLAVSSGIILYNFKTALK